jgi:CRP-like cAMP-binding protein
LQEFAPGRIFGEVAAFDGYKAFANFVALNESFIGAIAASDYREICVHDPLIAEAAFRELTRRARSLIQLVTDMSTLGVNNRIHAELLRRGRRGLISGSRSEINPPPTHADIAFRVNTQREVVTRELRNLEALGIIEKTRSSMVITCIAGLEALVESVMGQKE